MTDTTEARKGGNTYERSLELPPFPEFDAAYLPQNVSVHFHFTPHRTEEQFDEAAVLLQTSDVFIPEAVAWTERQLKDFNDISKGRDRALAKFETALGGSVNGEWALAGCRALFGTRKPVLFIDADDSRKDLLIGDFDRLYRRAASREPQLTMQRLADAAAHVAQVSYSRDVIMGERLGPAVSQLVDNHPKLADKEDVRVLIALGFTHTQLYDALCHSPAVADCITSSTWAGKMGVDYETQVVSAYKKGEAPTERQVAEFFIALTVSLVTIPSLDSRPLYDFNAGNKREPEPFDLVGDEVIRTIYSMGDDGLALVNKLLSKAQTAQDGVLLRDIAQTAMQTVGS
jgi:hypothetical protein